MEVKLFKNLENSKVYQGVLESYNNDVIVIKTEEKELKIDRSNIAVIKTIYKW